MSADPVDLARQVLDWYDVRVNRDNVDGRAAWVVQRSTPGAHPELEVIAIDDQTGLALRVDALHAGQPKYRIRVENLPIASQCPLSCEGRDSAHRALQPLTGLRRGERRDTAVVARSTRRPLPRFKRPEVDES